MKTHTQGYGALLDTRTDAEKLKDYTFSELVTSVKPVVWAVKKDWRKFPIYNQNGSGSCVAQTVAKMLGVMYWLLNGTYVHFSATHVYQRRINKPSSGMHGTNAADIARKGVTLEQLVPSQSMTDAQMDAVVIEDYKAKVGEVFKADKYILLPAADIEAVASVIQTTGKPVMVWFYFKSDEWTTTPTVKYPTLSLTASTTARHSITAVDFTLLGKEHTSDKTLWGKKALVIEDSWGTKHGAAGQRFITEDFYKARNYFALYFMSFNFAEAAQPAKPEYYFGKNLQFSTTPTYEYDVKVLQDILKYEGLFPNNVESTGYYGAVTAKAVLEYQRKYLTNYPSAELEQLGGKIVGAATRAALNSKYGGN